MINFYTYDLECYPNIFLFCGKFENNDHIFMFEISDRVNELYPLIEHLNGLRNLGVNLEMVGFNNLGYDYPIIHELMTNPYTFTYIKAHEISNTIIHSQNLMPIRVHERMLAQIDMYKVCHFDNSNKRTSLKALQFAMRSESLEDLPFDIRPLTHAEKDVLRAYNVHDVRETEKFFKLHKHVIEMRREYLQDGILFGDVLNFSDVKIGTEYLTTRIGRNKLWSGSKPRQTFRTFIPYKKIILPHIFFRTPEYQEVHQWFLGQTANLTDSEIPKPSLQVKLAGLEFFFGSGGVHASADNKIFHSDDDYQIIDIDVEGMYVSVAIANRFAPEHLGETFVESYAQVKQDRARYPKGTPRNAALKLAGNGAYGNSNNPFSAFFDPQYTYSVTINGQLQILQLVELIDLLPETEVIQANTDGVTIRIKKEFRYLFDLWTNEWEKQTGLKLEYVEYKRMWIRDVNNYIAEKMNGKLKRKGEYWYPLTVEEYEGWYNKDFSNHASKIAAEYAMTHSWPVEWTLRMLCDPFDFMLRYKANKSSKIYIGDEKQLNTVRYYVTKNGGPMKKISPPKGGEIGTFKRRTKITDSFYKKILKEVGPNIWDERIHTKNKSRYTLSETSIQSGWLVTQCNIASTFDWNNVDWKYYEDEAKRLIIGVK